MDGMTWFQKDTEDTLAQQAAERRGVGPALLITLATAVLGVSLALGVSPLGAPPVLSDEFPAVSAG